MKITQADAPTIRTNCHPSRQIGAPTSTIPTIFTPDALPDTTLPIYPGLGQAPNMLACIPSDLVWSKLAVDKWTDIPALLSNCIYHDIETRQTRSNLKFRLCTGISLQRLFAYKLLQCIFDCFDVLILCQQRQSSNSEQLRLHCIIPTNMSERINVFLWCWLTWDSLDKGPLGGCCLSHLNTMPRVTTLHAM